MRSGKSSIKRWQVSRDWNEVRVTWLPEGGGFQAENSVRAKILQWDVPWSVLETASQPVWLELGIQGKGGRKWVWQGWEKGGFGSSVFGGKPLQGFEQVTDMNCYVLKGLLWLWPTALTMGSKSRCRRWVRRWGWLWPWWWQWRKYKLVSFRLCLEGGDDQIADELDIRWR